MSGNCVFSGEFDVGVGDRNSAPVGTSNMFVKCHGEPENHELPYDHGMTTFSIWEIGIAVM
jgi:hypothetical protein